MPHTLSNHKYLCTGALRLLQRQDYDCIAFSDLFSRGKVVKSSRNVNWRIHLKFASIAQFYKAYKEGSKVIQASVEDSLEKVKQYLIYFPLSSSNSLLTCSVLLVYSPEPPICSPAMNGPRAYER